MRTQQWLCHACVLVTPFPICPKQVLAMACMWHSVLLRNPECRPCISGRGWLTALATRSLPDFALPPLCGGPSGYHAMA